MSTTEGSAPAQRAALDRLAERIPSEVPPDQAEAARAFAAGFTRRLAPGDLAGLGPEDLAGIVLGAFRLVDGRRSEEIAIRVFNPTMADDGYQALGTVVQITEQPGAAQRRLYAGVGGVGVRRGHDERLPRLRRVRDAAQ